MFTTSKARDRASDVPDVNTALLARVKKIFSDTNKKFKNRQRKIVPVTPLTLKSLQKLLFTPEDKEVKADDIKQV